MIKYKLSIKVGTLTFMLLVANPYLSQGGQGSSVTQVGASSASTAYTWVGNINALTAPCSQGGPSFIAVQLPGITFLPSGLAVNPPIVEFAIPSSVMSYGDLSRQMINNQVTVTFPSTFPQTLLPQNCQSPYFAGIQATHVSFAPNSSSSTTDSNSN